MSKKLPKVENRIKGILKTAGIEEIPNHYFSAWKSGATKSHGGKHSASKKGHKHSHGMSRGQRNHQIFQLTGGQNVI